MERIAIVSDIHANLGALEAVLRDIERKKCRKIYCLGDVIGYGPDPRQVLDIARENFELVILGNHDEAISYKIPKRFKRMAAKAAFWTRKRIKPGKRPGFRDARKRWNYLRRFPRTEELGTWLMAHGSPESNLEYVYDKESALDVFNDEIGDSRICFLGHTHVPGIFTYGGDDEVHFVEPQEGKRYTVTAPKAIVNVGSVGQPRDGDPRACWVLARSDGSLSFRRVEYEIEPVAERILKAKGLHPSLAERLFVGE